MQVSPPPPQCCRQVQIIHTPLMLLACAEFSCAFSPPKAGNDHRVSRHLSPMLEVGQYPCPPLLYHAGASTEYLSIPCLPLPPMLVAAKYSSPAPHACRSTVSLHPLMLEAAHSVLALPPCWRHHRVSMQQRYSAASSMEGKGVVCKGTLY